jgi:tripartite-type tricarboxylate transporter receptor subunit TctC
MKKLLAAEPGSGWRTLAEVVATPRAAVQRLNASIVAGLTTAEVQQRLAGAGVDAAPGTPEELQAWVQKDIACYRHMIKVAGAKPEGR